MARKWTKIEEKLIHKELENLYVKKNKTIGEIARILNLGQSTVYDRLLRLNIKPERSKKLRFNNKRVDVFIPKKNSNELAEFVGIMLGDGHITNTQVTVTLGNKENEYVHYVARIIKKVFRITPKVITQRKKYKVIYFGSVDAVKWLLSMGFVFNKVKKQVSVPSWIFTKKSFIESFLKGFFDTDGSVYKLKFGLQLSFTNRSLNLLTGIRRGLVILNYSPSRISIFRVYLTKNKDIHNFFDKIRPANKKHLKRYKIMSKRWDG